jgi:hypothetical protein
VAQGRLSALQLDVLRALAAITPPWRLTGGAALAGFYTHHRTTRDLDLFWDRRELGTLAREVEDRLVAAGFTVEVLQRAPSFCRLRAASPEDAVVVDLVADPAPMIEGPVLMALADVRVQVDTQHELLVAKLCALLSRSELRDLEDVRVLLEAGGDLDRALADAPRKDGGFSPITLAWVLEQFPLETMARGLAWAADATSALKAFRARLVTQVLAATASDEGGGAPPGGHGTR